MDEFNPSKQDLQTVESKIIKLKKERSALVNRKTQLQAKLRKLKARYKGDLQNGEFQAIKAKRAELKGVAEELEHQITELNDKIRHFHDLKMEVQAYLREKKEHASALEKALDQVTHIRDKYREFAKDRTRIASLRVMASEIKDDLDNVLKKLGDG